MDNQPRATPDFSGSESPAEVAKTAIEWCGANPIAPGISISYEEGIPRMKYAFQGGDMDYVCVYRLDQMLESFYPEAEAIFDMNANARYADPTYREILVRYIAFSGMTTMINHLINLQSEIFLQNIKDTTLLTQSVFLQTLVSQSPYKLTLKRKASKVIQGWIDKAAAEAMKRKREFLIGFMNAHQFLNIPLKAGRPVDTIKSEEQKAKDAEQFNKEIEDAVRTLYQTTGSVPTKTAVAHFLKPGVNPKTGTDSRLSVFSKKCKHLKVDFDAIVTRVCGLPK